ncbi:MAG: phosphatidylserine decarboxylase [Acidobacteriota bacterium]
MEIRSEALPYVLPPALLAAATASIGAPFAALGALLATVALGAFFRDPARSCEAPADAILAPADGVVVAVERSPAGLEIAVFLSVLNVHVTRSPVAGRLIACQRYTGNYQPAFRPAARHNARYVLSVDTVFGKVEVAMIAGAVARRIHTWVKPPETLCRGQRIGLIRFGSRTEVLLPPDTEAAVLVGDRVRAGMTIIARSSASLNPSE